MVGVTITGGNSVENLAASATSILAGVMKASGPKQKTCNGAWNVRFARKSEEQDSYAGKRPSEFWMTF